LGKENANERSGCEAPVLRETSPGNDRHRRDQALHGLRGTRTPSFRDSSAKGSREIMNTATKTACTCPKDKERVRILGADKAVRECELCGRVNGPMFTAAAFLRQVIAEAIEAEEFQDSLSEA
jgi:hypothetical protein